MGKIVCNISKKRIINSFIILPQGQMQECLFWGMEHFKKMEIDLLKMANRGIGNTRVNTNVIRVEARGNELFIFHLYPSSVRESFSNRIGQKAIIGYAIRRIDMIFRFSQVMSEVERFFNEVGSKCNNGSTKTYVPDQLIRKAGDENFYNCLNESLIGEDLSSSDLNSESENKKLIEIYKTIRTVSFYHEHFCYIRENGEYCFCPDRKLGDRLIEFPPFC